jgi:hypothetical protein
MNFLLVNPVLWYCPKSRLSHNCNLWIMFHQLRYATCGPLTANIYPAWCQIIRHHTGKTTGVILWYQSSERRPVSSIPNKSHVHFISKRLAVCPDSTLSFWNWNYNRFLFVQLHSLCVLIHYRYQSITVPWHTQPCPLSIYLTMHPVCNLFWITCITILRLWFFCAVICLIPVIENVSPVTTLLWSTQNNM